MSQIRLDNNMANRQLDCGQDVWDETRNHVLDNIYNPKCLLNFGINIHVENKLTEKIPCHKAILAANSLYIRTKILDPTYNDISLCGYTYESIEKIVEFLYSRSYEIHIDMQNVREIAILSHELQIPRLKIIIENFLRNKTLEIVNHASEITSEQHVFSL